MEGLSQANVVLTSSNYAVMAQLEQLTASIGAIQAQVKTITSLPFTTTKQKYYFLSNIRNYSHVNKSCPTKKARHKYGDFYKTNLGTLLLWISFLDVFSHLILQFRVFSFLEN